MRLGLVAERFSAISGAPNRWKAWIGLYAQGKNAVCRSQFQISRLTLIEEVVEQKLT